MCKYPTSTALDQGFLTLASFVQGSFVAGGCLVHLQDV